MIKYNATINSRPNLYKTKSMCHYQSNKDVTKQLHIISIQHMYVLFNDDENS